MVKKDLSHIADGLRELAVPIESIKEDLRNAVRHDQHSVQAIARSLEEFGQDQPLVVGPDGTVLKGNGRLAAAKALGWLWVAVVRVTDGETRAVERALSDNRSSEFRVWDTPKLLELVEDLRAKTIKPVERLGWTQRQLESLCVMRGREPQVEGGGAQIGATDQGSVVFGGATAMTRGNAALTAWKKAGYLSGDSARDLSGADVLDFGSGKQDHAWAKYDAFHQPDPSPLAKQWSVVVCNYVLNVQPAEHLIWQVVSLLYWLTKPTGTTLIAIRNDKKTGGVSSRGTQQVKTREEWAAYLEPFWQDGDITSADGSGFFGFVCRKPNR